MNERERQEEHARHLLMREYHKAFQPDSNGNYPKTVKMGYCTWDRVKGAECWIRAKLFPNVVAVYSLINTAGMVSNRHKPMLTKLRLQTRSVTIVITTDRLIRFVSGEDIEIQSAKYTPKNSVTADTKPKFGYIPPYLGKHKVWRRYPPEAINDISREVLLMGNEITDETTGEMHILLGFRRGYKALDKYLDKLVPPSVIELRERHANYPYQHRMNPVKLVVKNIIDRDYQPDSDTWRFVLFNLESISG